jgi:hypothetical protein
MSGTGQQDITDGNGAFNATSFLVRQMLAETNTADLVKVVSVTSAGALAKAGVVAVQPLVNQIDGQGNATPHGTIYNLIYFRMQGGANAVILDPAVGDIGMAAYCSRDISSVKAAGVQSNPGSFRRHDRADGIYFGGMLNAVPTQYVQFSSGGINIVSPGTIGLQATTVAVTGNLTISGTTMGTGDGVFAGTDVHTHEHGGVQTGTGNTGMPI